MKTKLPTLSALLPSPARNMNVRTIVSVSFLLLTVPAGRCSGPAITSLILNGQAQTVNDTLHRYLNYSVSPGALVYFTTTVIGGVAPLSYQWQLDGTNLP